MKTFTDPITGLSILIPNMTNYFVCTKKELINQNLVAVGLTFGIGQIHHADRFYITAFYWQLKNRMWLKTSIVAVEDKNNG